MNLSAHARWVYRALVVLALIGSLRAKGSAADETVTNCCDQSATECNSGQNVGDKGSCPGSQVCVQFVDKCKKKHPGVLCMCGDKDSNLGLSSTSLTFDKKSRRAVLTVSNSGNVPLDITILESGDTDAFDISALRRCKKKITSPAERPELHALVTSTSTAIVPAQGCTSYRVHFTAKKKGDYSEQLDIQSDAITPPTDAVVTLIGSVGNPGTGSSTTTSIPETTTTTTSVTSTTTMSTTTTTTLGNAPTCANGGVACGHSCGNCGAFCVGGAASSCDTIHCGSSQPVCVTGTPTGTCMNDDSLCPMGSVCVGNVTAPCSSSGSFCYAVCPE
jgi:hypothetical protein